MLEYRSDVLMSSGEWSSLQGRGGGEEEEGEGRRRGRGGGGGGGGEEEGWSVCEGTIHAV